MSDRLYIYVATFILLGVPLIGTYVCYQLFMREYYLAGIIAVAAFMSFVPTVLYPDV